MTEEVLSHPVSVARLPEGGRAVRFEASESEREALATFLSVPSVERLVAEVVLAPWRRGGVSIKGELSADIVQESVLTLEPVTQALREPVQLFFVPEASRPSRSIEEQAVEIELDPEGEDPPEAFSGDRIDLGVALREIVVLSLDPYPRGTGEELPSAPAGSDEGAAEVSPFAALSRLKPGASDG